MTETTKIIGFCWGSTAKAQKRELRAFAERIGAELVEVFTQTDVGRHSKWEELEEAIYATRTLILNESGTVYLVISTLSGTRIGLKRNVTFLSLLTKAEVNILIADVTQNSIQQIEGMEKCSLSPDEIREALPTYAGIGEYAAKQALDIAEKWTVGESERKKIEMAERKAKGMQIGANLNDDIRQKAYDSNRRNAVKAYADIAPQIQAWKNDGLSHRDIAEKLNQQGEKTRQGKEWNHVQVGRVLKQFSRKEEK